MFLSSMIGGRKQPISTAVSFLSLFIYNSYAFTFVFLLDNCRITCFTACGSAGVNNVTEANGNLCDVVMINKYVKLLFWYSWYQGNSWRRTC